MKKQSIAQIRKERDQAFHQAEAAMKRVCELEKLLPAEPPTLEQLQAHHAMQQARELNADLAPVISRIENHFQKRLVGEHDKTLFGVYAVLCLGAALSIYLPASLTGPNAIQAYQDLNRYAQALLNGQDPILQEKSIDAMLEGSLEARTMAQAAPTNLTQNPTAV